MDKPTLKRFVIQAMRAVPDVISHLSVETRFALSEPTPYKTYEFFLHAIEGLVHGVYQGLIGGVFIDTLANLISGQLSDAYIRAWMDDGHYTDMPPYLMQSLEALILDQYTYVDQFYRDIVDARVDGTSVEPLIMRARLWANRYKEAYNEAKRLIAEQNGGKLIWTLGATESHCSTCAALNGVVAYAREWEELGVHPQGAPNDLLTCGGWRCDCSLSPTDKRRSPKAFDTIMNAVTR